MTKQFSQGRRLGARRAGFTLVEMAVVLVIIGLILGAISVGKDVQRNAEYQKVINKFGNGWKKAYDEYYQRTGVVVGDSQTSPTYMVDGARPPSVRVKPPARRQPRWLPGRRSGELQQYRQAHLPWPGLRAKQVGAGDPPLVETVDMDTT